MEHFKSHEENLRPLYPLLPDILRLWDTVEEQFVEQYNASGGKAGGIGSEEHHFFKKRTRPNKLYYTGATSDWAFADGLRLPVFAAFRAALKLKGGKYSWAVDPAAFFKETVGSRLTRVVCQSLINTQDVTRTVRSESVWAHCYTEAELAVLKAKAAA
jgi:hypothetical protein